MQLGTKIKALRQARSWNAEKLATLTGIAPSTIYKYERGETDQMPLRNLYILSQVLEIPIPDLLELEDHETTDEKVEEDTKPTQETNSTVLEEKILEVLHDISNKVTEMNDKL